jgi:hypothetical protein
MYNARVVKKSAESTTVTLVAGEAIAKNDFVTILTDGEAEVTAAGEGIFGIALESAAEKGDSIRVLRVHPGMVVMMDNDNVSTTFAATHVGGRFDITGSSGQQLVDTSSVAQDGTDSGQLFCIEYNPDMNGFTKDTSIGLFEIAEIQGLTNALS